LQNDHQKFICKNAFLKAEESNSIITNGLEGSILKIPIAHGEGRFFANPEVLADLEANRQVIFRYCDVNGGENGVFNPNGSISNIAGICNKNRNVFGMMPHPERATNEFLGNTDGVKILNGLLGEVNVAV